MLKIEWNKNANGKDELICIISSYVLAFYLDNFFSLFDANKLNDLAFP